MAKLPGVTITNSLSSQRTDAADVDGPSGAPQAPVKRAVARAPKRLPRWARDAVVNMAHELRNPMQSALGFAQILLNPQQNENLTLEQRANLQRIIDAVQQMESVIRFMAAPELTTAQLHYQAVTPGELIRAACDQLAPQAQQCGIHLRDDVPPRLPKARLDRERVQQILTNLISNAVKFAPTDSTVTVGARLGSEKGTIEFFVHDDGVGVPKRYQQAIFHPFVQVQKSATDKPPGRGLGLAIVEQLVTLHGGSVWVESTRRQGSTFCVRLPLAPPES